MAEIPRRYPLLFTYSDTLFGNGFLVEVVTKGRALGVEEPGDLFWIYGVNPGALAACGSTLQDAHNEFHKAFRLVLLDFANESSSFADFKAKVERFFSESNDNAALWHDAVAEVRAGNIELPLPKKNANAARSVRVTMMRIESVTSQNNEPKLIHEAIAA